MKQIKAVPEKDWTWNKSDTGYSYDGVYTNAKEILWYTCFANQHAGGGGKSQSFEDFLENGPNVPGVPGHVIKELGDLLSGCFSDFK